MTSNAVAGERPTGTTSRSLVRGRWVICGATDPTVSDGAVFVEDGRIVEVGAWGDLRNRHQDLPVVGSSKVAVLPGLINAHHHAHGATAVQQGIPDDLLELWLLSLHGARASDPGLETLVSCARLLGSGVTTVVDMVSVGGEPDDALESADRRLAAYSKSGLRVAFAAGVATEGYLVPGPGEDQRFVAGLPEPLRTRATDVIHPPAFDHAGFLALVAELRRRWLGHPTTDIWYGPPGPQWVTDQELIEIADAAARDDAGIQIHVAESLYEKLLGPRYFGMPTVRHLAELGVLSPRLSLAHGVWLNDDEIGILADAGATVSHNPSSNLRLRAGIGPLVALLDAGVTVGLGLDANGLNDDDDAFTEMRMALRLQAQPTIDAPALSVSDAFALATSGGARLLRRDGELGRIAPGYAADLVLIDLDDITWPWIAPEADPRDIVLLRATRRDVDSVMIAGEIVFADGGPTRFQLDEVGAELAGRLTAAAPDAGARELAKALRPYVASHYRDWGVPELVPYTAYNSRI